MCENGILSHAVKWGMKSDLVRDLKCEIGTAHLNHAESVSLESKAYTSKRRILIEVLPVPNAYTKSGDAYIHFAKSFCCLLMNVCIVIAIRPQCVYQVYALSV